MQRELPGPRARQLLELRSRYVPRGVSNAAPTFALRGEGAVMEDVDGNRFVDFAGGYGMINVGHAHPEVVEAVKEQAERFFHTCFAAMPYEPYVQLARRLAEITPGSFPKKAMFVNSGAEAVENAVKIARYATGRPAVIAFEFSFHGRTLLGMTLTGKTKPYKDGFGPLAPEVYHVPAPYCYRCPSGLDHPACGLECLSHLRRTLETRVAPNRVAAILAEPVLGEGGYIVPPADFLPALRDLCREHGILLIADEVQSGFARTGRMFAVEHSGVEPDLITMAKSMGAGIPIAAVVGRAEIMDAPPVGGLGSTFGGSPLGCVAALKVIEIMERDDLPGRANRIGELVMARFRAMQERYPLVGDVRGVGAMVAIELVRDRGTKEPATSESEIVQKEAFRRGLLVVRAGLHDNVIRVLVPLVAEDAQVEEGLAILEAAVAVASGA